MVYLVVDSDREDRLKVVKGDGLVVYGSVRERLFWVNLFSIKIREVDGKYEAELWFDEEKVKVRKY